MLANEGHDNWITVSALLARTASDIVADHGNISMTQYRLLIRLKANDGVCAAKKLAEDLAIAPSTVTGALNDLEPRKAIKRTYTSDDNRVVNVRITEKGLELLEAIDPAICELAHDFWSTYTPEELAMTKEDSINTANNRNLAYVKGDGMSVENAYVDSALVVMQELTRQMHRANISANEYRVLHLLSVNPCGMRPKEISRKLLLRSNEVTVAAKKLADHGRIERLRIEGDRRASQLVITQAGHDKLAKVTPPLVEAFRSGITELAEDAFDYYDAIARKILERSRREHLLI